MTHASLAAAIQTDIDDRILAADVELLNDHGVSDTVVSHMAAEHAARSETLAKMIEPTMGRALLLMISGALLSAAKQIDAATVTQPEFAV
jgi:hypothetical protein